MAVPWLVLLKTVPWSDVISNAPKVASGAKKLWNSVSRKPDSAEIPETTATAGTPTEGDALAAAQAELRSLRIATTELREQMMASSELIRELADQNTALIKRLETYRIRLGWLAGWVAVLTVATGTLLFA